MSKENQEAAEQHDNETEAEKQKRFTRNCRDFIDYINYDWETDSEWTTFEQANMKDIQSPKQKEEIKREYFKMNVNQRLDTSFTFETEIEKQQFLDVCKYVGSILSLG